MDRRCASDPDFARLEKLLRDEAVDRVRQEILSHVEGCEVCAEERRAILADRALLAKAIADPPTIHAARAHEVAGASGRTRRLGWPVLAAAVPLVAAIAVAVFVQVRARVPRASVIVQADDGPYAPREHDVGYPQEDGLIRVPPGADRHVALADGSDVWLRGGAAAYLTQHVAGDVLSAWIWLQYGSVECRVEHVRPGGSFVVATHDLEARVRGTRFVVRTAADEDSTVDVLEGRVQVRRGDRIEMVVPAAPAEISRPVLAADAPDLVADARRALAARDYERAKNVLGHHLATYPRDDDARYLLGEAERLGGDPDAATRTFEALASGHGRVAENALARLAFIAERRGPEAAVAAWDRYLAAYPRGTLAAEGTIRRANTLYSLGRRAEARSALERFLTEFPDHPRRAEVEARLHDSP
jgi:tetratricopeptide (TPR) repeat protein